MLVDLRGVLGRFTALATVLAPLVIGGCGAAAEEESPIADEAMFTAGGAQMLGMQHTPRKVVLPLQVNDRGFALRLYEIVDEINKKEGLKDPASAISLLVWSAKEDQFFLPDNPEDESKSFTAKQVRSNLMDRIRKSRGLGPSDKIPNFEIVESEGQSNFVFMQDLFETFAVKATGSQPKVALLDLESTFESNQGAVMTAALRKSLPAQAVPPELAPKLDAFGDDDDGGNLEVTHEGRPYVGSTTTPAFRASVQKLTGQAPIVIPTEWLFVGHVDEYVTFLPAKDECKAALAFADPLEALNIVRERKDVPAIPREDVEGEGKNFRDEARYKEQLLSSLEHFVRPEAKTKKTLALEDFDRAKPIRDFATTPNLDVELLGNLHAHEQIRKGVDELKKASKCLKTIVGVPQLLYRRAGSSGDPATVADEIARGYTAASGYLNLVSLRDHVVIAKEPKPFFGPIVQERLGGILGDRARVHEIDALFFERGAGSVHCTTNVVRSATPWQR